MPDLIRVEYGQKGTSTNTDELGMREMQARAFASRDQQYLLIKAPPASGKSRALMFLALDKLIHQGLRKAIVAVPETSIGASFDNTDLASHGFYADWQVLDRNNLCRATADDERGKIDAFKRFLADTDESLAARTLVCTHATLRFAFDQLSTEDFNGMLLAVDEFHHVSADHDNRLGALVDSVMSNSDAHVVAMTGSYFRGDAVPVLMPEDEAKFQKVTYTYYEQLNGYQHLKSLGIGYHFYSGNYLDAVREVLDPSLKTIVYIPNVNSRESTKDKYREADGIIDALGSIEYQDSETGIFYVRGRHGKNLKVANLVDDNPKRPNVMEYLRQNQEREDMDVIIALGMAKEGFDWPWCEHVLTIGYRNSLTEVVQIIGRATRDAPGKRHAQFTNLIAQPDAEDQEVKEAVNNMLKAISVSLLMEQVLAPNFRFRPRVNPNEPSAEPSIEITDDNGNEAPQHVVDILNTDGDQIRAELVQDPRVQASLMGGGVEPEVINMSVLPDVVRRLHPDLSDDDVELIRRGVTAEMALSSGGGIYNREDLPENADIVDPSEVDDDRPSPRVVPGTEDNGDDNGSAGDKFLKINDRFVNLDHLKVDLIDQINPFQGAYEILSKSVTPAVLKALQDEVASRRIQMTEEEATILWPRIKRFKADNGRDPSLTATDPWEKRYAEALVWIRQKAREREQKG